jgi:hypothetical protein
MGLMPKADDGFDPAAPSRASAVLMRELADKLEAKAAGWAMVIVVNREGEPTGFVPEVVGLLPEDIRDAMARPYDVQVVALDVPTKQ